MINYTFVYASAQEEAPDIGKEHGLRPLPAVDDGKPSKPPLGGINLGVSAYSKNKDVAFEAAACLANDKQPDDRGRTRRPAALALGPLRRQSGDEGLSASPTWSASRSKPPGPRPRTPAYQDVSLAIQRTLHPPDKIDPEDTESIYDELKSNVEDAVKREGLL